MTQTNDDEPTLLLAKCDDNKGELILLNEGNLTPKLNTATDGKSEDSNMWYLDNGASNHMTGQRSKFTELDESVTGRVKFGDGSTVRIQRKGSV